METRFWVLTNLYLTANRSPIPDNHTPHKTIAKMRALLRPLATHTVFSPIETVVAAFVLATLAYFHILDGIKHSSFFSPTFPSTLRPSHVRLSQGEWLPVGEREWFGAWKHGDQALELQQLVFNVDEKTKKVCAYLIIFSLACVLQAFRCGRPGVSRRAVT